MHIRMHSIGDTQFISNDAQINKVTLKYCHFECLVIRLHQFEFLDD